MSEPNEVKQEVTQQEEVKQETPQLQQPEVDLVTRVSQVKPPETPKVDLPQDVEGKFNINDLDSHIEKIPDPALKEQVLGLKKSLLRGENQKYQEIANLRKQYEQRLAEVTTWTPDRLKQELNKPDFVQAAQQVLQTTSNNQKGLSDEQYSALSEGEKKELNQLKQKINMLEQSNWQALKSQQDAQLKNKYTNYAPDMIDTLTVELVQGKRQATREDLWKAIDYDDAVRRAYELGKQDKISENKEKIAGMTFESGRNMATPVNVEKQKGESAESFMRRSYAEHTKKK